MGIHVDNWKDFFFESNEGWGTLYDRVLLERYFQRFIRLYGVKNALDCPSFGLTGFSGIGSIYLAWNGIDVTVCDHDSKRLSWIEALWDRIGLKARFIHIDKFSKLPFENQYYDLVWNFSALWHIRDDDMSQVLAELGRVTDKCLFLSVHNMSQLVYPIWKRLEPGFFPHVAEKYADKRFLEEIFKEVLASFTVREEGYLVTTPWPGIILKRDQLLKKCGKLPPQPQNKGLDDIQIPQYINRLRNTKLTSKAISSLLLLEKLPNIIKKRWSHLTYWIFTR